MKTLAEEFQEWLAKVGTKNPEAGHQESDEWWENTFPDRTPEECRELADFIQRAALSTALAELDPFALPYCIFHISFRYGVEYEQLKHLPELNTNEQ